MKSLKKSENPYSKLAAGSAVAASVESDILNSKLKDILSGIKPHEMSPKQWGQILNRTTSPILENNKRVFNKPDMSLFGSNLVTQGTRVSDIWGDSKGGIDATKFAKQRGIPKEVAPKISFVEAYSNPYTELEDSLGEYKTLGRALKPNNPLLNPTKIEVKLRDGLNLPKEWYSSVVGHELEHASDNFNVPEFNSVSETPAGSDDYIKGLLRNKGRLGEFQRIAEETPNVMSKLRGMDEPSRKSVWGLLNYHDPGGVARSGSLGHFKNMGNFETEFLQKSLAEQALKEGRYVHPEILDRYPDLKEMFNSAAEEIPKLRGYVRGGSPEKYTNAWENIKPPKPLPVTPRQAPIPVESIPKLIPKNLAKGFSGGVIGAIFDPFSEELNPNELDSVSKLLENAKPFKPKTGYDLLK